MSEVADRLEATKPSRDRLAQLAGLLERSGIGLDELGRIERVNAWQGFYKDADGEAHTVDMVGVVAVPTWADGPQWPVVQQAAPTKVVYGKRPATAKGVRVTAILPDPQIGYLRHTDGTLEPIHDESAIAAALDVVRHVGATRIVNLGDTFDFAAWSSKFLVLPEFVQTTQPAIDRGHRFLAEQRAIVGAEGEVVMLGGNHDDRLPIAIARNAAEAMRLRRANLPDSWPVMSLPHLLRLDELGVTYVGAYPAGKVKLADGHGRQTPLFALHGTTLDVRKDARERRQSVARGHAHHIAHHTETFEVDGEPLDVEAFSLGCLCRLDGAVPSTKGGYDDKGAPFRQHENWQHALGVLTEHDGGGWDLEVVRIRDGRAYLRGRVL